jgi:hypothetical protein
MKNRSPETNAGHINPSLSEQEKEHQAQLIIAHHNLYDNESGIVVAYEGRVGLFALPEQMAKLSPRERYKLAQERLYKSYDKKWIDSLDNDPVRKSSYFQDALHILVPESKIGGIGTTGRTREELEELIPGISGRLDTETGKIVFLGNGFSEVPVDLAKKFERGEISEPPAVVDIIDYKLLARDLNHLKREFENKGLSFIPELQKILDSLNTMVEQIDKNNLIAVRYQFGSGTPPASLKGAHLGINTFGPPKSTLDEQMQLMDFEHGAELYIRGGETITTVHPGVNIQYTKVSGKDMVFKTSGYYLLKK